MIGGFDLGAGLVDLPPRRVNGPPLAGCPIPPKNGLVGPAWPGPNHYLDHVGAPMGAHDPGP